MVWRTLAFRESYTNAFAVDELTYKLVVVSLMLDSSLTSCSEKYRVSASLHTQQTVTALGMHLGWHP